MHDETITVRRPEQILMILAACVSFCNPHRFPPIAGFWGQWAAVALFGAWVCWRQWARAANQRFTAGRSWAALGFYGLALICILQTGIGLPLFRTGALVPAFEFLLAGLVCEEAARARRAGEVNDLLECLSWGVLLAILLNAISIVAAHLVPQLAAPFDQFLAFSYHDREVGLVGQSNHLGILAVLGWVGAGFLQSRHRLSRVSLAIVTVVAALICASSSSRTALLIMLILSFTYMLYRPRETREMSTKFAWARTPFALSIGIFIAVEILWQFLPMTGTERRASIVRSNINGRVEMLRDALLIGSHHPLLGAGFGNYAGSRLFELTGSFPTPNADNAHNLFGQVWAEWGVFGLTIVIAGVFLLAMRAYRSWKGEPHEWAALFPAMWVATVLVHSQVEHPLWSAHFLFPFAWMLGVIGLPDTGPHQIKPPTRGRVTILASVLGVLIVMAGADYRRSEALATEVLHDIQSNSRGVAGIPKERAMRIADLSLFPVSAQLMAARSLDLDPLMSDIKLDIATATMKALPHGETISRYVAFLVLNGRQVEADKFLQTLQTRDPPTAEEATQMLREIAPSNEFIAAFLMAAVKPGSSGGTPVRAP